MTTNHKKSHWGQQYIRYLISYLAVLLIPLVILTYFYSSRFMKKFYEEIFNTVDLELAQLEAQLDNQLTSMENIVNQILLSGLSRQAAAADSPLELSPIITSLSGFCAANPFIHNIVLISEEQEYLVTKSTTCKKDYYFDCLVTFPENNTVISEELFTTPAPVCIPRQSIKNLNFNSSSHETVLFSFPLYSDYQKREGTVLFFIEDTAVQRLLNQKLQNYQSVIFILNSAGTVITSSKPGNPADLMAAYSGNPDYLVRCHTSEQNQWSYLAYLPNKQATFSQVSSIMREFILTIVLILLIASFTIYMLQKINYAPVQKLKEKVNQIIPDKKEENNELTAISNALDYLSCQNTLLSNKLEGSFTAVKNERLYRLIGGAYASREDFNLDCSELNLALPHDYFFISIFMFHKPVNDLDLIAQTLKKQFSDHCVYYCLHNFRPDQIIFLHNLSEPIWMGGKYFFKIQTFLKNKYNISTTIGVGTVKHCTGQIGQSYMEAVSALDYRFVKGNGSIIEFKEALGANLAYMSYPHQEFELLRNALLRRSEKEIQSSIQNIIHFMEQGPIPLYQARNICYNLIHLVNEQCQSGKNNTSSPLELSGIETAQEIIQMLRNWSRDLTGIAASEVQTVTLEKVLSYVNDNCLNCEFSAYETAEHFHMLLPAFSKFFKDAMGQTIMDYIIVQRMQKAKELLASTDMPLKDIAEQVGYYNLSSFTRRFKLSQGITPSQYRKFASNSSKNE